MIIDNKKQYNKKSTLSTVWEYIYNHTENKLGMMNIVTGYFSVSGLYNFAECLEKDLNYRMILAEMVKEMKDEDQIIDLLQEDSSILNIIELNQKAKTVIDFFNRKTVEVRAILDSFCHAKAYIYDNQNPKKDTEGYYLMGSANMTNAGLGNNPSSNNVELNIAETGSTNYQYEELMEWFNDKWESASDKITDPSDKTQEIPLKEYFVKRIEQIYREYSPKEIYYKILFELFNSDLNLLAESQENRENFKYLKDSVIYNTLFDYQKNGVVLLIKMLQKYNGAILADAVGLGKTFSALAVMKYYQNQGYLVLVLCPKKLKHNWEQYLYKAGSRFEKDRFNYSVRFHTDLQGDRLNKYPDTNLDYIQTSQKVLVVVDESHNMRNNKSSRYETLLNEVICNRPDMERDVKLLLLSATPVNNGLKDLRNQVQLIAKGNNAFFNNDEFHIPNIEDHFTKAQAIFTEWSNNDKRTIRDLVEKLSQIDFFNLVDKLVLARTRKLIQDTLQSDGVSYNLKFPKKLTPVSKNCGISNIGELDSIKAVYDVIEGLKLTAYRTSYYKDYPEDDEGKKNWQDNRFRQNYLVYMMSILFMKRLESCWISFKSTLEAVLKTHKDTLEKVETYLKNKNKDVEIVDGFENTDADNDTPQVEDFDDVIGGKKSVKLSEIVKINEFKADLKSDVKQLGAILDNLKKFEEEFANNYKKDKKLAELEKIIKDKQKRNNKKVIVFTAYSDTAIYLYNQLKMRGLDKIACVTGSKSYKPDGTTDKNFGEVLERFSPYSKLFQEKDWSNMYEQHLPDSFYNTEKKRWFVTYEKWQELVAKYNPETKKKLDNEIDILIATDCLSEGQNLQDCDLVVNYDIHWNPVRLIQRFGRIDRLGSRNEAVGCVNFWPTDNLDEYLNLKGRIEKRMTTMNIVGSETMEVSPKYKEILNNNPLDGKNADKLLEQMNSNSISDLEDAPNDDVAGLHNFTLDIFRQDLIDFLNQNKEAFKKIPCGVFSGFEHKLDFFENTDGLVAVLGFPKKQPEVKDHVYTNIYLMFRSTDKSVADRVIDLKKPEILQFLRENVKKDRYVPKWLDHPTNSDKPRVKNLSDVLKDWMVNQMPQERKEQMKKKANSIRPQRHKGVSVEKKFNIENFDLIVWEYVSNSKEDNNEIAD